MITESKPDRAHQLALILQAIEDLEREKADFNADHKARMERLQKHAWQLRNDILSGQLSLVVEAEPLKGDAA
jgi:hypothetical protein